MNTVGSSAPMHGAAAGKPAHASSAKATGSPQQPPAQQRPASERPATNNDASPSNDRGKPREQREQRQSRREPRPERDSSRSSGVAQSGPGRDGPNAPAASGMGEGDDFRRPIRLPDNQQLFVGNLPHNVSDKELKEQFEGAYCNLSIQRTAIIDME